MRKRLRGRLFMGLGLFCLAGALTLTLYNNWDDDRAAQAVVEALPELTAYIAEQDTPYGNFAEEPLMETALIDDAQYLGLLDIPAIDIQLPILSELSYPHLKQAPCLYTGNYWENSMIIAGHNYKRHFGKLSYLTIGDPVHFTDVNGLDYVYTVAAIETLEGTDIAGMLEGDWDLTLFTCTYGGASRVTVRCIAQEQGQPITGQLSR